MSPNPAVTCKLKSFFVNYGKLCVNFDLNN